MKLEDGRQKSNEESKKKDSDGSEDNSSDRLNYVDSEDDSQKSADDSPSYVKELNKKRLNAESKLTE